MDTVDQIQSNFGRPIPGQSLTSDPNNPAPYEQASRYTTVEEASKYLWDYVTEDRRYATIMQGISEGIPVMDYVKVILFKEFSEGAFNPDLMMMMAEPLAFMIIALAERLDLDIKVTNEDDEDENEELFGVQVEEEKLNKLKESAKANRIPAGFISDDMREDMGNLPSLPSLLESQEVGPVEGEVEAPSMEEPSLPPVQEEEGVQI